jgi:hypothetical protein
MVQQTMIRRAHRAPATVVTAARVAVCLAGLSGCGNTTPDATRDGAPATAVADSAAPVAFVAACLAGLPGCVDTTPDSTRAAAPSAVAPDSAAPAASSPTPPPTDSVYVVRGICFGEGECFRHWRASATVPLHAQADPASPVVATVPRGAWVEPVEGQYRLLPRRGVVQRAAVADSATPPLAVGEVVYMLEPRGEGTYVLWHRGVTTVPDWTELSDQEPIRWDPPREAPPGVVLGWWVRLRLENGTTGWVQRPRFACMTKLGGESGCRG